MSSDLTPEMRFIRAICPEAPELYLASFNERKALTDGADLIESQAARIAELERLNRKLLDTVRVGEIFTPDESTRDIATRVGDALITGGYLDRLLDMTPEDNAERIIGEVLPKLSAAVRGIETMKRQEPTAPACPYKADAGDHHWIEPDFLVCTFCGHTKPVWEPG